MADWTEKYRPTTLSEVRGNDKARGKLKEWADTWDDHREAVILHGSPGVGKTSAAHALASDLGWDVMELNASDSRTGDVIDRVAGEAAQTSTLSQATQGNPNRRLIVMDEADNLHGNADRGGTRAITRVVKEASQPMVLIANDFYGMSNGLRNACQDVEFRDVSARSIVPALRDICRKEGIEFEEEALTAIAEQTSGDLRSAINDLQAIAEGETLLTVDDVVTGERDRTTDIFEFLDTTLKEGTAEEALRSSYDVDETPDDLINWIEDNLPKDYAGTELAEAYDHIATADRWLGRVRATQNYSYWRYASDNMTAGVAAARSERKGGWTRWGAPSYWSKLGRSRSTRDKRDDIARRIAEGSGASIGTVRHDVLPFLSAMIHHCKPRELTVAVAARYDLDESDLAFVTGSGETTNKVQGIVEDAQRRREEAAVEGTGDAFLPGEDEDDESEEETKAAGESEDGAGTLSDFGGDGEAPETEATGGDEQRADDDVDQDVDDGTDPDERAETVEEDDQQSGLGDFV